MGLDNFIYYLYSHIGEQMLHLNDFQSNMEGNKYFFQIITKFVEQWEK